MQAFFCLLLLLGFLAFVLAAFGVKLARARPIDLVAVGLAFWILVPLIQHIRVL